MNDLDIKYNNEARTLLHLWNRFIDAENLEISSNDDEVHLHTPPALVMFFDKIVTENLDLDDPDYGVLINIMNTVFKFGTYFRDQEFNYEVFTKCECVQITDEDIELLRQGIS